MSRPSFQSPACIQRQQQPSATSKQVTGWRHPCVIQTDSPSVRHASLISTWLTENRWGGSVCLVTDSAESDQALRKRGIKHQPLTRIESQKFRSVLGQEFDVIIYDLFSGLHPDALAAISGCLKAGGVFILYAPPIHRWSQFEDPQLERLLAYPLARQIKTSHFLSYFQQKLSCSGIWNRLLVDDQKLHIESMTGLLLTRQTLLAPPTADTTEITSTPQVTPYQPGYHEQSTCIDKILALAERPEATLVISAGRGRGKSAALGISTARWLRQADDVSALSEVWITAPRRDSVSTLFKHARSEWQKLTANSGASLPERILFLPPDELLKRLAGAQHKPALLLVDEAASIPLHLLTPLLTTIQRCVFAVTTHGYEGCGQGFRQRFIPAIEALSPGYQHCQLQQPIRWMAGDPLEAFFTESLMLSDSALKSPAPTQQRAVNDNDLELAEFTTAFLLANTDTLGRLFKLLMSAHYRSTPDDLRTMLDSPEVRIFGVTAGGKILACLLLSEEQPLTEAALRDDIWLGKRRPKGHLIQQTFAQQLDIKQALQQTIVRIVRIAVLSAWQRQGIGSWLLHQLPGFFPQHTALQGVSYASEPSVNRFWSAQGFHLVRLGSKRDPFTGSYSALMVKAITTRGSSLIKGAKKRFAQRLAYDLLQAKPCDLQHDRTASEAPGKPASAIPTSLAGFDFCCDQLPVQTQPSLDAGYALDAGDLQALRFFAAGHRAYPAVADTLYRASLAIPEFTRNQCWQMAVCQQFDLKKTAELSGLPGKKAVVSALREATAELLTELADQTMAKHQPC